MIWHLFSLCVAVLYHEIINMCKVNVSLDLIALIFISEVKHITLPGNSQIAYIQNFRVLKKISFSLFFPVHYWICWQSRKIKQKNYLFSLFLCIILQYAFQVILFLVTGGSVYKSKNDFMFRKNKHKITESWDLAFLSKCGKF